MPRFVAAVIALLVLAPPAVGAVPDGFTDTQVVTGIAAPTAMALAPDGRVFALEQEGNVRVVKDGELLPTPFVSVPVDAAGERGLLGIAFDPAFESNGYVYLYYTATTPTVHNRVSRFTAEGDVAVPGSEQVVFELDDLSSATNHNGGAIHFGPDGKLYVGAGENADGQNSQTLTNVLGKILRLNADGSIPADNPFYGTAAGKNRAIWALGLRNPFTFAFQPGSGRLHINDVGASTWEEINLGMRGANYGWPYTEGPTSDPRFRSPIFAYRHGAGPTTGCAITGAAFYNPQQSTFPSEYVGDYFFADLCSGWIRRLDPLTRVAFDFASGIAAPVDLLVTPGGDLLYLARGTGSLHRVSFGGSEPAPSIAGFEPTSGPVGTVVVVNGSGFTGTTSVAFNGVQASFSVVSDGQLQATVPSGATTGPIAVTTPSGTATSAAPFTVSDGGGAAPTVTGFQPSSGATGTSVTISGTDLGEATEVRFNGSPATFTVDSPSQITATVPDGATSGPVSVTTPAGTATSAESFTVTLSVTEFRPASGRTGASVLITGVGFSGATAVTFNGVPAAFAVLSPSWIIARVPAAATSGVIAVTTPAGTAQSAASFTKIG